MSDADDKPRGSSAMACARPLQDGARECMLLPDSIPADLDYERYVQEAESILEYVGFYGPDMTVKMPRVTIKNHKEYLKWMSIV